MFATFVLWIGFLFVANKFISHDEFMGIALGSLIAWAIGAVFLQGRFIRPLANDKEGLLLNRVSTAFVEAVLRQRIAKSTRTTDINTPPLSH